MHPLLRHLGSFVLAAALAAPLAPARAQPGMMVPPPGYRPKDFAFVKKDGVYHLFYIRHNDFLPPFATEIDFGHAVSSDLYHWTNLPTVMGVGPNMWDNLHVWAPTIVEWHGLWWMFYTGITDSPQFRDTQRIGVAVSSDLMTWNRIYQDPVWSTASAPWAWWAPLRPGMACRDPFVMKDPTAPTKWLMYYTASPANDTLNNVIGVARSPGGDLAIWQDEKPLWITHWTYSYNTSTESPHLFEHNGRWFLVITSNAGQPLSFFVTSNPIGDPAEWQYRGRLKNMINEDTSDWFASEALRDGERDYFAYARSNHVEIRMIQWDTGDNFHLVNPPLFHMPAMTWDRASVRENQFVGLRLQGTNGFAFTDSLEAFVKDAYGKESPAPIDSLGLPSKPSFPSDSVQIAWFARRWPASLPANQPMQVRIAMADGTASTGWLRVWANAVEQQPFDDRGGRSEDPPGDGVADSLGAEPVLGQPDAADVRGTEATAMGLRVLQGSPISTDPVITFELAEPAAVRVEVFDVLGRRVTTLADRTFARGAHVLPWDERDASGGRLTRGLYFVRLTTPTRVSGTKLLVN